MFHKNLVNFNNNYIIIIFLGEKMSNKNFIANSGSKEVHIGNCYWSKIILKKNRKSFESLKEALYEEYDACGHCLSEYNQMIDYGLLLIHESDPSIKGEFILPRTVLHFSLTGIKKKDSIQIKIELNQKYFEVLLKKTHDGYRLTVDGNKSAFNIQERLVLKKFLISLNKKILKNSNKMGKFLILLGRSVVMLLKTQEDFEMNSKRYSNKDISGILKGFKKNICDDTIREREIKNAFEHNMGIPSIYDGKTVNFFMDKHDDTYFVKERRDKPCVFKGESVQGWWKDDSDSWKKAWGVVDGIYGGSGFGGSGCYDLVGPIDMITGWFYSSVDHDMCCRHEKKCFGPCAEEFICAMDEFLAGCVNLLPLGEVCNGNNPPPHLKITDQELDQGYYHFEEDHPMAGRKIGTPIDWKIDLNNKRWWGNSPPEIYNIQAEPNPFTQESGTTIEFDLARDALVKIELYHKEFEDAVIPIVIIPQDKILFKQGSNALYWNGRNSHNLPASSGYYTAKFFVNGCEKKEIKGFLRKKLTDGGDLPRDNLLERIQFSPNPFSIETKTKICFQLRESAYVSIYIYHQNWSFRPRNIIKTIIEDKWLVKDREYCYKWDGRNNIGVKTTNGEYKLRFLVNGKEKVKDRLKKVRDWQV